MNTAILYNKKISVKCITYATLVLASICLPQLVHLSLGAPGGKLLLPMYLPVLVAGCLMGSMSGMLVGILSPLVSYTVTSVIATPMPATAMLPIMTAELAIFGLVSGLWSKKIAKSTLYVIPAILSTQICGRLLVVLSAAMNGTFSAGIDQVVSSWRGLVLQIILVPVITIVVKAFTQRNND